MSSMSHKAEKRGLFQQIFNPKPTETIKGPSKKEPQEVNSHLLGQGTAQKAGAAFRGRKATLDANDPAMKD